MSAGFAQANRRIGGQQSLGIQFAEHPFAFEYTPAVAISRGQNAHVGQETLREAERDYNFDGPRGPL